MAPRASIHMEICKSFNSMQANENERNWDKSMYEARNADEERNNHYDWSRHNLNFEVVRGSDGKPEVQRLNSGDRRLHERYQDRLDELGFKSFKASASNQPNTCVDFVLGGDRDRMREMAFGTQEVAFDLSKDNSHITRGKEIENWAVDCYEFLCEKYGEKNVVGLKVHLDETNPHLHALVIPVAQVKKRGRKGKNSDPNATKEAVSFAEVFGHNKIELGEHMAKMHTDFFEKVGRKYGLERGTPGEDLTEEERSERRHKTKVELKEEAESRERIKENNKVLDQQALSIDNNNTILSQQNAEKRSNVSAILEQKAELENIREEKSSISLQFQEMKRQLQEIDSEIKEKSKVKVAFQGIRDRFSLGMWKTIDKLKKSLKTAEKAFNDLFSNLTAEINQYKSRISSFEQEKSDMEVAHRREVSELQIKNNALQNEIDTLNRQKTNLSNARKKAQESLDKKIKELEEANNKANSLKYDIEQIKINLGKVLPVAATYKLNTDQIIDIARNEIVSVEKIWNPKKEEWITAKDLGSDEPIKVKWNDYQKTLMAANLTTMQATILKTGSSGAGTYNNIDVWVDRAVSLQEYWEKNRIEQQQRQSRGYRRGI